MKHQAVIEVGPLTIRRLCCGVGESADAAVAVEWIDDPVALVDGQPVAVCELLRTALACPTPADSIELIHPSWWPARRIELVTTAARALADDVVTRGRSAVLFKAFGAAVVVEIAARLVAVTAAGIIAEPRIGPPDELAAAVVRRFLADHPAVVVIDAPAGVGGAGALAAMIAERLLGQTRVVVVDKLPAVHHDPVSPAAAEPEPAPTGGRSWLAVAAALGVVALGLRVHPNSPPNPAIPTTYLIEGRVAVQVPVDWPVRRVTGGPGSARVEVVSPTDARLVLHLTQAPAAGENLAAIAEPLQRALQLADAESPGAFLDFDPAGSSAGRPAVTYREVRADHHVDWVVLVDHAVRIGIGCQSGPGGDDALRPVCEQAVRSAHTVS